MHMKSMNYFSKRWYSAAHRVCTLEIHRENRNIFQHLLTFQCLPIFCTTAHEKSPAFSTLIYVWLLIVMLNRYGYFNLI